MKEELIFGKYQTKNNNEIKNNNKIIIIK